MNPELQKALTRYRPSIIPYDGTADYLRAKFQADDRYWAHRRQWREQLMNDQLLLHRVYGMAPECYHDEVRDMSVESKLEHLSEYLEYLMDIKQGNREAKECKWFIASFDIREELGFDHWLAARNFSPSSVAPTPNWGLREEPEPTKVEVHPWGITIWSW